tara:strand:- start:2033 stop:2539 length:507 start_codon:yes stop_codon:yes gene_type:complete
MFGSCKIRLVEKTDLPMLLQWRNHPDIRKFMFTQENIDLKTHYNWFEEACRDSCKTLLIVEENHEPLGFVQFIKYPKKNWADWGFYTGPDMPKGSGQKLGSMALNYAFSALKYDIICGQSIESNEASIKFHIKMGFSREEKPINHKLSNGNYVSIINFILTQSKWFKN